MYPKSHFHFCPRCGAHRSAPTASNPFECPQCQLRYYFNPAAAVAVFIENAEGQVLLIRRAKDPGKNRLAPPGGFIDIGVRAETALSREIAEEIGIQIHSIYFLCSQTNEYTYGGVTYPVLDLFLSRNPRRANSPLLLKKSVPRTGTRQSTSAPMISPLHRCKPLGKTF
ncbi:MAG: NUDIX domain-containing protein [Pedosphaera sp.]|nr:NUDIX domain-containing protein [Pedosphaera sp.]